MLSLEQILFFAKQQGLKESSEKQAMVEYLQTLILQLLVKYKGSDKISFIGGTSLRFFYNLPRFSEDLDFDNFGLSEQEFDEIIKELVKDLVLRGFVIDSLVKFKGAYHCYLRFSNLLYQNNLSTHVDEKILVKIDTTKQDFIFKPERKFFNRYGITEEIQVNPIDILMAQKTMALLGRKRAKGRDFFDFVFLDGITKPNLEYLKKELGIDSLEKLKVLIIERCSILNFDDLAKDVEPFLFNFDDVAKVRKFRQYITGWNV
ncbi:MAG: hypothetical protein AUJ23_01085 [Candidatus Magasanikbacteria bacterium CG1_02_32_51]|uniref:Nucleotidyl transferase AbiEii/AbiGii toxin family protein n=2 Tax=Candidatus Magasanikiibacteriota TaxID=1752731 RepID=A0A1J4U9D2_9BACT|nr:MAG: hypothetical protein AUJ23_01085 [Candidatus Magasanikbacteria bacterium CG1_02_32_51]